MWVGEGGRREKRGGRYSAGVGREDEESEEGEKGGGGVTMICSIMEVRHVVVCQCVSSGEMCQAGRHPFPTPHQQRHHDGSERALKGEG